MDLNLDETRKYINFYANFINPYEVVLERIARRLDVYNKEQALKHGHNPIHNITKRIKSLSSIQEKLTRRGLDISFSSARENLTDIAGVRVVCYFLDDILTLVDHIHTFEDCDIIKEADYLTCKKKSGYRSFHIVLNVPLGVAGKQDKYPVEIQLRTLAMDFWASIEHELRYKNMDFDQVSVLEELSDYSEILHDIDRRIGWFYNEQAKKAKTNNEDEIDF